MIRYQKGHLRLDITLDIYTRSHFQNQTYQILDKKLAPALSPNTYLCPPLGNAHFGKKKLVNEKIPIWQMPTILANTCKLPDKY